MSDQPERPEEGLAAEPLGEWQLVAPRVSEQEYDIEHHGDVFYVRVNDRGRNFRLAKTPVASPGRESWTEVVPHRPEVMLEGVSGIADYQCGKLLGGRYHRLAPVFPPGVRMPLDAVARVPEMIAFAEAVDLTAATEFLEREWT